MALGAASPAQAAIGSAGQGTPRQAFAAHGPYSPGVVLVGYRDGAGSTARAAARGHAGAVSATKVSRAARTPEKLRLRAGASVEKAIDALLADPAVRFAEPDYLLQATTTSNDPYYTNGSLWGMLGDGTSPVNQYGSAAGEAWAAGYTGSRDVVVGIIDEGIQFTHPDLAANIWTNPFDAPDGIDNDGNGFIDDTHGWDFFYGDNTVYDGAPGNSVDAHGTHVSGTIGGQGGNGNGVAGVNWQVTLISAKFLGPNGGYTSDAVAAADYLTDLKLRHGIDIVASSNSWGGGGYSQALDDAIERGGDADILFVAAAGNSSTNNDAAASYPSNYQCTTRYDTKLARGWDCVVAVAAITSSGTLASYSSYGATTVDLGAPGSSITSTVPTNIYASYSGTSMATPHVSGAVALCASINRGLSAAQLRAAVVGSTAATTSLAGKTATGGRLDIGGMVGACLAVADPVVELPPLAIATVSLAGGTTGVAYSQTLAATGGQAPYAWSISAGSLPTGLALSATSGLISGTPTGAGTSSFTVLVADAASPQGTATRALSIAVAPGPPGAFGKSKPRHGARLNRPVTLTWTVSAGAASYQYCIDKSNDNACTSPAAWTSAGTATSVVVSTLVAKTTYYWQVRAVNAAGTTYANSGTWWRFATR